MSKYIFGFSRGPINSSAKETIHQQLKYFQHDLTTKDSNTLIVNKNKLLFISKPASNLQITESLDFQISFPGLTVDNLNLIKIKETGNKVEVYSDSIGDRVIWYYLDENWFFISNSQFYILRIVGNYTPNEKVWPWMLANGNLSAGGSWDKRINAVPPQGSITLSIDEWKVEEKRNIWKFEYQISNRETALELLKEKLFDVASQYKLSMDKTLLTLSGGYDSRATLYLLKGNHSEFRTATWGTQKSFSKKGTDSYIARKISLVWQTHHQEFLFRLNNNFDSALEKFLFLGEGRNDHINSFMDGLQMWEDINKMGYTHVVRADEAFGWLPVSTELDARLSVAMGSLNDFNNIPGSVSYDYPIIDLPDHLLRHGSEPVEDYRDRLYQTFRLPFVIGPLQDIPLNYVETINPLLHPQIIQYMRRLPPEFRTNKNLYAEWVKTLLPEIPFAYSQAIPKPDDLLFHSQNKQLFISFVNDTSASRLLGNTLINFLKDNWDKNEKEFSSTSKLKYRIIHAMPSGLKKFVRNKITGYTLPVNALALRALIIYKMQMILNDVSN